MEIKDMVEAVNGLGEEVKSLRQKQEAEIKELGSVTTETKAAFDQRLDDMNQALIKVQEKQIEIGNRKAETVEAKTLGQLFTDQEIKLNQERTFERKDITSGAGSAGALARSMRVPEIYKEPDRPQFIRDLLPNVPTSEGSIDFLRELNFDNQAGPQDGELTVKNKSSLTFEEVNVPIRTVAHHVIAARQVLADAPRLQSYIDNRLAYGLRLQSDEQLLYGTGLTGDLTGLMVDANVEAVAPDAATVASGDLGRAKIAHIRKAITALQVGEYRPNGVVINPVDWEDIETATDGEGRFIVFPYPANGGEERLWRVPVTVTNAINAGEFLIGDWSMGATLYVRETVSVRVSESHADLFIRNGVAILGEERMALAIELPGAYKKGTFPTVTE